MKKATEHPTRRGCARTGLRVVALGTLALTLVLGGMIWYVGFHDRGMNLHFDPDFVGDSETRMWQLYYGNVSRAAMGMQLLRLMRAQFGLSYRTSILVAEDVAAATLEFHGAREESEYENKVLPNLIHGYTRLCRAVNGTWDPEEVARAELDWWVARRTPGRSDPQIVGQAIAHEYSLVYGKDNEHVQRAGFLRAKAARQRDDTAGQGPDWKEISAMLRESYSELLRGISE